MDLAAPSSVLRPLGLGEILDRAVTLSVRRFPLFAAIRVLFQAPYAIAQYEFNRGSYQMLGALLPTAGKPADPAAMRAILVQNHPSQVFGVIVLVAMLAVPPIFAALTYAVSAAYLGRNPTFNEAIRAGVSRWLPLLGVYFFLLVAAVMANVALALSAVVVVLGVAGLAAGSKVLAVIIGGVLGVAAFALVVVAFTLLLVVMQIATFICVVEGAGPLSALRLAVRRVLGSIGIPRSVLFGLIYSLIALGGAIVAALGAAALVTLVRSVALSLAFTSLVNIALAIFLTTVVGIYYFDLRVREEGLDLELAAQSLTPEGDTP
ncbi:MAG: hypothetical protein ACREM2_08745 [Vulcanimicrobiaceae bacterium]